MPCDCSGNTIYEIGHRCIKECQGKHNQNDDDRWYEEEIASRPDTFDTSISKAQWIAWRSFWDDATKTFRTENVDASGKPIGGTGYEKPTDCPPGTTKFANNQCLPLDDSRVSGGGGGGTGGGGGGGGAKASAPPPPDYTYLPYSGNPLQDALADMFNYRAGIFGTGNQNLSGATPRTPKDAQGKDLPIAGTFLPGGGVWWGAQDDLTAALKPFVQTFAPSAAPAQVKKKKKKQGFPEPPDVVGSPEEDIRLPFPYPKKPVPKNSAEGPLTMALSGMYGYY